MTEVVRVERIHTADGSHIEPPLDQDWDDLTKLRPRDSFESCTCEDCKAARAGEANDEARSVISDGLWAERGER